MTATTATARAATPAPTAPTALDDASSISEASLSRAVDRLTAETGLTFPRSRRQSLRRALATASAQVGAAGVEAFLDELGRQPSFLDRLVSLVTIGETYFFRHPEQLDVLSRRILPSLIAVAAQRGTQIRAWSAGCSTGEEAYSLAMLIDEALGSRQGSGFHVAATDIDHEALRRARKGSYGRWSFRSDLGDHGRWFDEVGSRRTVRRAIADRVTFAPDNLSLDGAGRPPALDGPADLIVCRNVTMYLSNEARRRVADRFLRALAPGGWLMVAPVEVSSDVYGAFDTVVLDGLTFYRKPPVERGPQATAGTARPPLVMLRPDRPRRRSARPVRTVVPQQTPARTVTAQRLADQGLLADARREAELAVGEDPRDGAAYLLLASIADAQEDLTAAAAALRRAIYLDRGHAAAQFRLGLLEWRVGRKRHARARLTTAVVLVADRAESEILDHGSDLTVGRLRTTAALLTHD